MKITLQKLGHGYLSKTNKEGKEVFCKTLDGAKKIEFSMHNIPMGIRCGYVIKEVYEELEEIDENEVNNLFFIGEDFKDAFKEFIDFYGEAVEFSFFKERSNHNKKRGRPRKPFRTKLVRIPVELEPTVKKFYNYFLKNPSVFKADG